MYQPAPSFSTPSTSFQTSYVSHDSPVQRVNVEADLVVRPDRICFPVSIEVRDRSAEAALRHVEETFVKLAAASGAATRVDDIRVQLFGREPDRSAVVTLRGLVEAPLPDGDPFTRARKVAALTEALAPLDDARRERSSRAPELGAPRVLLGEAEPGVRDVEQHRGKLLQDWAQRARTLAAATAGGALELTGCTPPAQVSVVAGTLEKVGLRLAVSCSFTTKGK